MMFSVVIPVHNGEQFIEECLESAVEQVKGIDGAEIIIVENGSTDRTAEICDRICAGETCVRVIHEGAIGLYLARQVGIKASKGDYILALDSDDRLMDGMLGRLKEIIEDFKTQGVRPDILLYGAADMDNPQKRLTVLPFESLKLYKGEETRVFKEVLCQGDAINAMWIKCISRDIAYIDRELKGLNYGEDLFQTAVYLDRAESVVYLDEALYLYRVNASSLSASYNKAYLDNQKFVWNELDELIAKWNEPSFAEIVDKRKALTCAIAVVKIMHSSLSLHEKKKKFLELFSDDFYKDNYKNGLPEFAPLEECVVYDTMLKDNALVELLGAAFWHDSKERIKKVIRGNGI